MFEKKHAHNIIQFRRRTPSHPHKEWSAKYMKTGSCCKNSTHDLQVTRGGHLLVTG